MLAVVEDYEACERLKSKMFRNITKRMDKIGRRNLGFQGNHVEADLYSNGHMALYFCSVKDDSRGVYWNSFGTYNENSKNQNISAEINIKFDPGARNPAGFFSTDGSSVYLCHTGRVGGGRKGVGMSAFRNWLGRPPVNFSCAAGSRTGFVVCKIDSEDVVEDINQYITEVEDFKSFIRNSSGDELNRIDRIVELENRYNEEFFGNVSYIREKHDVSYDKNHGLIVSALRKWLQRSDNDVCLGNSRLIDLYIVKGNNLTDIYEIKPRSSRSSLYSALGQLIVHSAGHAGVKRHVVLPQDEQIPADVSKAIKSVDINIIYFTTNDRNRYQFS